VALGQVFSEYFGFPCQSSFHQLLHNYPHLSSHSLLSSYTAVFTRLDSVCCTCSAGSLADLFLFSTLKMETVRSSETSVNTISTRRHIPEDGFINKICQTVFLKNVSNSSLPWLCYNLLARIVSSWYYRLTASKLEECTVCDTGPIYAAFTTAVASHLSIMGYS
jgi:hypothetical protein